MRERNGCDKYITKTLVRQVYFPEGQEVCSMCPFCIADPSNHKKGTLPDHGRDLAICGTGH